MTTLTAPHETTTSGEPPGGPGPVRLRLRRAGAVDKWFELSGGKCTIGSSPRCHVCLPAAEAQPLQCLLSLEAGAAFATKWASGVLLNGQTFAKAAFGAGDRLSIGPWEIEWDAHEPSVPKSAPRPIEVKQPTASSRVLSGASLSNAPKPVQTLRETADFAPVKRVPSQVAAPLRETVDFSPAPPVETPPAALVATATTAPATFVPPPSLDAPRTVEASLAPVAKRPAAKTMLIASRETDPFAELLGPAKPAVASPLAATNDVRSFAVSQTFEDRLLASLWTSNFAARKRAKSLAAAARIARERVQELTASVSTLEGQLFDLRSAGDIETAELRTNLESLRGELAQAQADRDLAAADLAALQSARPSTPPPDPRLQTLSDAVAVSEREATELRETLAACQEQIETLRAERAAAESALLAAQSAHETAAAAAAKAARPAGEDNQSTVLAADLAAERAEREQERQIADEEAARLREQLYACELQLESLRTQVAEVDAARDDLAQQLAAVHQQQFDWLAECNTLEQHRAAELAAMQGERDDLRRALDEFAARPAATIASASAALAIEREPKAQPSTWQAPSSDIELADDYAERFGPTPAVLAEPIWRGWDAASEPVADQPQDASRTEAETSGKQDAHVGSAFENTPALAGDRIVGAGVEFEACQADSADQAIGESAATSQWKNEADVTRRDAPAAVTTPTPDPETEPEAPAETFTPPSFIDKYKHLLDDESEAPTWPSTKHQLLDEEHMSPSKPTPSSSVEEDSDEALEAYMSNMMRRMRSGITPSHAAAAPKPEPEQPKLSPVEMLAQAAIAEAAAEKAEPEIELDANGMLRMVRKPGILTADFVALRELANSTARTAIAEHRQRRHVESALTKSIVCAVASATSTYLMLTAPSVQSPWFWGGCATLVMAAGSAAQLGNIVWQRLRDGGRTKAGVAAGTAPEGTT